MLLHQKNLRLNQINSVARRGKELKKLATSSGETRTRMKDTIKCQIPNIKYKMSNIKCQMSNMKYQILNVQAADQGLCKRPERTKNARTEGPAQA